MKKYLKPIVLFPLLIIVAILIIGLFFINSQRETHPKNTVINSLSNQTSSNDHLAESADINISLLSENEINERLTLIKHLPDNPQRIVVMEYSFLGDLAALDLSPVGIADDNKPETIIPELAAYTKNYTPIGSRYQPSLESIADLNPDLIIADKERHSVIEDSLNQIAPTVVLKSRGETYEENIQTAQVIGHILHQDDKMAKVIEKHLQKLATIKAKLISTPLHDSSVQFAIISDKGMWLHGPNSYAGSLLTQLGIESPIPEQDEQAYIPTSLEQLVAANPDWLLIGRYNDQTVFDEWQTSPLFQQLSAVKYNRVIEVDPNYWALNRSMQSAEHIADKVLEIAKK